MADKPDFNKLKNKFDLGAIVDNLKSMINPTSGTPDVDPDDDLGVKIAKVSVLLQEMVQHEQAHIKNMQELNVLLNFIYSDIELLRQSVKSGSAENVADAGQSKASEAVDQPVSPDQKKEE